MSRTSIRSFLATAKRHLQQAIKEKRSASFVIGNESADLDSITCALVYGYLQSTLARAKDAGKVIIPVTNIPASDLRLRPELTTLLKHAGLKPSDLITLDDLETESLPKENTEWTLVDHNVFQGKLGKQYDDRVVANIDHHDDEQSVPKNIDVRIIEKSGSCNSLIVNHFQGIFDSRSSPASDVSDWDAQVAKLSLGAILIDTSNMTDENKVTDHDRQAVKYLEARIAALDSDDEQFSRDAFYHEIDDAKTNLDDLTLDDILRKDFKQWTEGDITLGTAVVTQPLGYLRGKPGNLEKTLEEFSQQRSLHMMALMTAYTDKADRFARELKLLTLADGQAKEAAHAFLTASKDDLQLEDIKDNLEQPASAPRFTFDRAWNQKNLAASRKQVAPLLREAARSVQGRKQKM